MKIEDIIKELELIPHPEGGYYKETLRVNQRVCLIDANGNITKDTYSAGTSIYYLLGSQSLGHFSAWHRLNGLDETWNYHAGVPLTIYWLKQDGTLVKNRLGLEKDAHPQVHIPRDCWFSAVVEDLDPSAFTLVGCVVFPGFEFKNFEIADRATLTKEFPQHRELIERLTRIC